MGIKERKERHKLDIRQKVLEAAKELFLKDGYEATSIRKIAEKIEFSPTTIYLYYKDKADIIFALHQEGFKLLVNQFEVLQHVHEPFERLKAMGRVYLNFAIQNPDYYELMFIMKEPLEFVDQHCGDEGWEDGATAFTTLIDTVEHCKAMQFFTDFQTPTLALNIWAAMHGMCSLKLQGHLDKATTDISNVHEGVNLLEQSFECFVKILEKLK